MGQSVAFSRRAGAKNTGLSGLELWTAKALDEMLYLRLESSRVYTQILPHALQGPSFLLASDIRVLLLPRPARTVNGAEALRRCASNPPILPKHELLPDKRIESAYLLPRCVYLNVLIVRLGLDSLTARSMSFHELS